jgi:lipopolysaccharide cholinephosphotransferase
VNALQKAEFEILCEFVRICDELKLTYFLVCGTALGAVKYGGFIPWDDDVDVALPRKDYEIFC